MRRMEEEARRMMEDVMKGMEEGRRFQKGGPVRYGFSLRIGPDGKPVFEEFGNVKRKKGAAIGEEREPLVDVIDRKEDITVIAEVPGVEKKDIKLKIKNGKSLYIRVEGKDRKYDKLVQLPARVKD
ncbi:MAG: Hsp20/alpha crystallin family protein, partial [Candidatus Aenigmarchaeota archaeon]|nr:Hsp20/alpha crystallin family protein [Candidatus Aenigmarchaeota archaeon]